MSKFTKNFKVETDFDGDHVEFELQRMRNEHMIKLGPYFSSDGNKISFAGQVELIEAGGAILPECIVSMRGLKDADGNALTKEDIIGQLYFSPLIDWILGQLLKHSLSGGIDAKKLDAPSVDSPPGLSGAITLKSVASV